MKIQTKVSYIQILNYIAMFLYMQSLNEGGSEAKKNKLRFKELQEGENPKVVTKASSSATGWSQLKNKNLANYNWEKRRASFK